MSSWCAGLLGAAPTMPLLANPALSAALLQLLLQNQAKAQQVLLLSPRRASLLPVARFDSSSPTHAPCFFPTALSFFTISKPFWGIIFCGLRCCTIKKTL